MKLPKITRRSFRSKLLSRMFKEKNRKRKLLIFATFLSSTMFTLLIIGIIGMFVLFAVMSPFLPDPNKLLERNTELSTRITDRNGKTLYEVFGEKNRTLVPYQDMSIDLSHATLAAEDATFYEHSGFYFLGIVRGVRNRLRGQGLQGGSTITQQVVKNTLLSQERTISRKIKEFALALQIENRYKKEEILQLYLNESPYGGQNYGVYSASQSYFSKKPSELTLAESAYLAGLPQSPTYYSPYSIDPEAGIRRQHTVLGLMKDKGWVDTDKKRHYISQAEYDTAINQALDFKAGSKTIQAPHFVFYVRSLLIDKYGEDMVQNSGMQVKTSLDLDIQQMAETIVQEEVAKAKYLNVGNAGFVAMDPKTGQILAMIGSKDFFGESEPKDCTSGITGKGSCTFEPSLNTTTAERQPGSSIKPITYAALLEKGYTASFPFMDVPTNFPLGFGYPDYKPVNYDGNFRGPISLRKALGNSINVTAVKSLKMVTLPTMLNLAHKMGITTLNDYGRYGLALTLGGGETKVLDMTNVYATFAAGGLHRNPVALLEVKDAHGNPIDQWRDTGGEKVLSPEVAYLIANILSDDGARADAFGANSLLNIPGHAVAAKTGTTDDKRDNHAYGFTPSIAVGVWVGNNNNSAMNPYLASGITGATPIWSRFMKAYLKDKPNELFVRPDTIIEVQVDKLTGMLPYKDKDTRKELFVKGTEPTITSPWYLKLEVCKEDGRIANDACIADGKTKTKNFIKFIAELPEWQDDVDKWVSDKYKDDDQYFPPTKKSKYPED